MMFLVCVSRRITSSTVVLRTALWVVVSVFVLGVVVVVMEGQRRLAGWLYTGGEPQPGAICWCRCQRLEGRGRDWEARHPSIQLSTHPRTWPGRRR